MHSPGMPIVSPLRVPYRGHSDSAVSYRDC